MSDPVEKSNREMNMNLSTEKEKLVCAVASSIANNALEAASRTVKADTLICNRQNIEHIAKLAIEQFIAESVNDKDEQLSMSELAFFSLESLRAHVNPEKMPHLVCSIKTLKQEMEKLTQALRSEIALREEADAYAADREEHSLRLVRGGSKLIEERDTLKAELIKIFNRAKEEEIGWVWRQVEHLLTKLKW